MTLKSVDATTLKQWLDHHEALVIDVREPAEYTAENIAGSVLLPLAHICKQALPATDGKKLVIHCRSGKRGASACEKLMAEDPSLDLYHLEGGIAAWTQAGYDVCRSDRFCLPLDRQVQLTVGLCVLTGSLLAYAISPLFILVPAFFGAGLIFAGLTGFCGLAMLMAKMPWNQCANTTTCCWTKSDKPLS